MTNVPADTDFAWAKNLDAWSDELHTRRKIIADTYNGADNPYLRDPFPTSYAHTFDKDLVPGQAVPYRFVSPYKCKHGGWDATPPGLHRVGLIHLTGT